MLAVKNQLKNYTQKKAKKTPMPFTAALFF